jgi:hypothetical protein
VSFRQLASNFVGESIIDNVNAGIVHKGLSNRVWDIVEWALGLGSGWRHVVFSMVSRMHKIVVV